MTVDMKNQLLSRSSHIHYFGVKDMNTKKEVAYHGMNSNLTLIPSGEHVSTHFRSFKAKIKTENFNFSKISPMVFFSFLIFLQKLFRESTFQHISDHLRPKTKSKVP